MHRRGLRRLLVCLGLAGLLAAAPAVYATEDAAARNLQQETRALQIETLFGQLLDSAEVTPVYTDLGNGFHSLSITLKPEARERLLAALRSGESGDKATTFFLLAAGQQLTPPSNPSTCIHAALSLTNASYNYWVVVLNLGSQNLTRTTSVKLAGPGRNFNKSIQATYNAGGIWAVWYNPAGGVNKAGIYTYTATVSGAGSFVTRSFAVNP
jgi:hypothetical protein